MNTWPVYLSLLATGISMANLSRIAITQHNPKQPKTLSELAAAEDRLLKHFRTILLTCGTLFAVVMYGYIIPRISNSWYVGIAWTLEYVGNLLSGCIPAQGITRKWHNVFAQAMGVGMLGVAYLCWFGLNGFYASVAASIAFSMTIFGALTVFDKRHYVIYELAFIYLSHFSIVTAAIALR